MSAYADTVQFEFGVQRINHMAQRETVLRWQATSETLFLNLLALAQVRPDRSSSDVSDQAAEFRTVIAQCLESLAEIMEDPKTIRVISDLERMIAYFDEELTHTLSNNVGSARHEILDLAPQVATLCRSLTQDVLQTHYLTSR